MSSTELSMNIVKVEDITETLQACRICLAWDGKLYNISEGSLDQMYVDIIGTTQSVWDGFPQQLCGYCQEQLLTAHALRERGRRAEIILKQALMHQRSITNSYIRSINRAAHKLTITASSDIKTNLDHNLLIEKPYSNFVGFIESTSKTDTEVIANDVKEIDLNEDCGSAENDFENESSLDADNFKIEDEIADKINNIDAESKVKTIEIRTREKKRPSRKKAESKKKEAPVKFVKKKKETPAKQKKFNTEEDFKEFEKKYDFQVQRLTDEEMAKEMEKRKESNKYLKGDYKCDLCYKGFLTASTYENHKKTHDPARGENECHLCHVRYQFPVKLRHHVQSAHRLKFRCAQCGELVRGKSCAVLHAAFHAGTTFPCAHCDKRFLKKTSRTSHMRMAHPAQNAAGGSCEECGETFTSRTGLKAHKTRTHKKPNLPELTCRRCRIQFDNMDALRRHKDLQENKCDPSTSACERCGEICADADSLIQHKHAQHEVELYTCDTCSKSFTSKPSLATHMDRVHRAIRPRKPDYSDGGRRQQDWLHWASVCELCGKRLSCLATLKIHMNKHTGERPYKCSLCPRAYMTPYGLSNHQAYHTGVRKWQCPDCPATFMHQSSVYQHRKIHTGERSHQCTICNKYFTQSGSLYTHVKYVHLKETPPPRRRGSKAAKT